MTAFKCQKRVDAGRRLAAEPGDCAGADDLLGLALSRGGVPVACEVAQALGAQLDLFLGRTLGVPGHEELTMGATGGVRMLNGCVVRAVGIAAETAELAREVGR